MTTKVLLSFPRSGNHLVRFFIELLSEQPTNGYIGNPRDIPIFQNEFPEQIPFNIDSTQIDKYDTNQLYTKYHTPPPNNNYTNITELIFIVRNPKEVLLRHCNNKLNIGGNYGFLPYFQCIDYYTNFTGNKICFFYEDILTDKIKFIEELYSFLNLNNESKKEYVIQNIDKLYELSKNGKKRDWGGVVSNDIHFYYKKIDGDSKIKFDDYLHEKIKTNKYNMLRDKYSII
jgi:hypothetical protein